MCLYHYLYYSSCQHGELTLISYCDNAKALGIPERDRLSRRNIDTGIDHQSTTSLPTTPRASSSPSTHSELHSNSQHHRHRTMTTLSPSKSRSIRARGTIAVDAKQHSPAKASHIPRSVLPESGEPDGSPHAASLTAAKALEALSAHTAHHNTLSTSGNGSVEGLSHTIVSTSTPIHNACDSDVETSLDTSESSIDIITERSTIAYGDVKSASPRKPLPARWLPVPTSPGSTGAQQVEVHNRSQNSLTGSPTKGKTVPLTSSLLDLKESATAKATFLTKEALDAVNASITSPTLRRSPIKNQQSPAKRPWNSPTTLPKATNVRRSTGSPTKESSPRAFPPESRVLAEHRRAPSSVVSTGATTFHTAMGSPVRSSVCSQSSFSSDGDLQDQAHFDGLVDVTDIDDQQVGDLHHSRSKTYNTTSTAGIRSRSSRPELTISIPPRDSAASTGSMPVSGFASAKSGYSGASPGSDRLEELVTLDSATLSSRIPRTSMSKGSTARAPTLSSSLKQTKSTQTLRSPKAAQTKQGSTHMPGAKNGTTKSSRYVRTLDSTGSTPIQAVRKTRDVGTDASSASSAAELGLQTSGSSDEIEVASRTPSRATSSSTVKATKTDRNSITPGIVHSSDADDEDDDSAVSASNSLEVMRDISASSYRRTASSRRSTMKAALSHPKSTSDLRATAREFVPAQTLPSEDHVAVAANEPMSAPVLPNLYALDGYGIPWYYHMYPVPWLFPPAYTKGRSKSPRKFRPKKQRPMPENVVQHRPIEDATMPESRISMAHGAAVSNDISPSEDMSVVESSEDAFASQMDEITRQAALQSGTHVRRPPHDDLTAIRNVSAYDLNKVDSSQGHYVLHTRPRNPRHVGNGLYGGRGGAGVPLHATAPFPSPIPPMGRPNESFVGYATGTKGCGAIDSERAMERGGGQACNTCEPDH